TTRKEKAVQGVGFSMEFPDAKKQEVILPVSAEHPGVSDPRYRNPAPHHLAPKPYGFQPIPLGRQGPAAHAEDVGRGPEAVVLLTAANFEGAPWRDREILRVQAPSLYPAYGLFSPHSALTAPGYGLAAASYGAYPAAGLYSPWAPFAQAVSAPATSGRVA